MDTKAFALCGIMLFTMLMLFGCEGGGPGFENQAISENNPKLCDSYDDLATRTNCYQTVAAGLKNTTVCRYLRGQSVDECYTKVATENREPKFCDAFSDNVKKYQCVLSVTGAQAGDTLENIMSKWNSGKCKDGCDKNEKVCKTNCDITKADRYGSCMEDYKGNEDELTKCMGDADTKFSTCMTDCTGSKNACNTGC